MTNIIGWLIFLTVGVCVGWMLTHLAIGDLRSDVKYLREERDRRRKYVEADINALCERIAALATAQGYEFQLNAAPRVVAKKVEK